MKALKLKLGLIIFASVLFVTNAFVSAQVKGRKSPGPNPSEKVTVTLVRWPYT